MRILYFSDNCSDHNRGFLEKLSSFGHKVWFLDATSDSLPKDWLPPGVQPVSHRKLVRRGSDPSGYEELLPEFRWLLAELKPDLVHAGPVQGCAYVASLSGFHPLLVTSWGSDLLLDSARNPEWRRATTVALRGADGFMCDCDAVREAAQRFVPVPDSRIAQFPWGLKRGAFSPVGPLPASLASEPDVVRFICTRSWEPLYGVDVLLEAFQQAYNQNGSIRLLLLGDGSMAGAVHDFVGRHGLREVVLTPGRVSSSELPGWFRGADAYISCARSDGTSVSLLEAMATGLPVLVTDIPSNREWVSHGENGWLAMSGSAEDFAEKICQIASLKPFERAAIGERNPGIVAERADWDRNFLRLTNLYDCLLKVTTVVPL